MKKRFLSVALAVIVGLSLTSCGVKAEEIKLSEESIELKVDDSKSVSYEITPEKASNKTVNWESSDENVAVVDENGEIKAVGKGSCKIKATVDDKNDILLVTVKSVDFNEIFETCELDSEWASIADDGSWLFIDTNPIDSDEVLVVTIFNANDGIERVNAELGIPESVYKKMTQTSALDGRQTSVHDDVTVSWKYHPDKGLEVMYELN